MVSILSQNNPDDQRYADIVADALARAGVILPAWNDYNTHDPGVTLIEMLAWLTEAQRFHMDQSKDAGAFFPLLGIQPMDTLPAAAEVYFPEGAPPFPSGLPLMAEDIGFETNAALHGYPAGASCRVTQRETLCEDIDCGKGPVFRPCTFLSARGEVMLFWVQGDRYRRVSRFTSSPEEDAGFHTFTPAAEGGAGEHLHIVSCGGAALRWRWPGYANGFPGLRFTLDTKGQTLLRSGFVLLVGEDAELSAARRFTMVDDFRASGPGDAHYTLDGESGVLTLGDGLRGLAPTGVLFIASAALTRGAGGNIMAGRLRELVLGERSLPLTQPLPAAGGAERERTADTMARYRQSKRQAVTAKDIETLVLETPHVPVEMVCVFGENPSPISGVRLITIAAKPVGGNGVLTHDQRQRIRAHLEPYRLAGYEFAVISPHKANIRLRCELNAARSDPEYLRGLERSLSEFFRQHYGGFPGRISPRSFAAFLSGQEGVSQVRVCTLRSYSSYAQALSSGDIALAPGTLVHLEALSLSI